MSLRLLMGSLTFAQSVEVHLDFPAMDVTSLRDSFWVKSCSIAILNEVDEYQLQNNNPCRFSISCSIACVPRSVCAVLPMEATVLKGCAHLEPLEQRRFPDSIPSVVLPGP